MNDDNLEAGRLRLKDPFAMLLHHDQVIDAVKRSDPLARLNGKIYRPLDRPKAIPPLLSETDDVSTAVRAELTRTGVSLLDFARAFPDGATLEALTALEQLPSPHEPVGFGEMFGLLRGLVDRKMAHRQILEMQGLDRINWIRVRAQFAGDPVFLKQVDDMQSAIGEPVDRQAVQRVLKISHELYRAAAPKRAGGEKALYPEQKLEI